MAADKKTLLREAVKLVQKGQMDKAIATYREIVKLDPKDAGVHNSLGDLYIKQGKKKEAIAEYLEVASHYERDGWGLRAIAMCQKILNLDSELLPVRQKLADLYAAQKLPAEARAQYLQVADRHDRKGDVAAALEVFRKIADLDPENLAVRAKLAGMFEKQKYHDKAAAEYVRSARGYLEKKDRATAIQLFVRAFKLHPGNLDARRGLAEYHHQRQDWQVVVGLLQPLAARGSGETDLLVMYGEALTRVNHPAEAAAVLEKARERDPNAVPVNLALGRALLRAGDVEQGIAALNRCVSAHLGENKLDLAEAILREMAEADAENDRIQQRILEVVQRRGDRDGAARTWLRLAHIRERKGLLQEAAGALEKYLEIHPADAAVSERVLELRTRPTALEPEPPSAAPVPVPPPPAPAPPRAEEPPEEEQVVEIDLEGEELAAVGEEQEEPEPAVRVPEEIPLAAASAPPEREPAPAEALPAAALEEEEIEIDLGEPAAEEAPVAVVPPSLPEPPEAPGAEEISFEDLGEALADLGAPTSAGPRPPTAQPAASEGAGVQGTGVEDVEGVLAEADFYFQQGLLDEAESLYRRILGDDPHNAAVAEKLAAIASERGAVAAQAVAPGGEDLSALERELDAAFAGRSTPSVTVSAGPAAGGGEYADFLSDLRQELETELAPSPPRGGEEGLAEIFQEFQRSVKEQLGPEDFDTHYNLGIAYKEMGLMEEAIGEFALAERSPTRGLDAVSMIALCLRAMGRVDEAMQRLEQGIARAKQGSDEHKGLLYDLALLQEGGGREAESRETFRRLAAVDPGYRDVAARLGAPGRPATAPGAEGRRRPKVSYL